MKAWTLVILVSAMAGTACAAPGPSSSAGTTLRDFVADEVGELGLRAGDASDAPVDTPTREPLRSEPSDRAWQDHLADHGLLGRWWSGLIGRTDEASTIGEDFGFIMGARVSLWASREAAAEALTYENSRADTLYGRLVGTLEASGLGDGSWCGVLDVPERLSDRAWCRFRVSNATFDVYIRTGSQHDPTLHPDAPGLLRQLALRISERNRAAAAHQP